MRELTTTSMPSMAFGPAFKKRFNIAAAAALSFISMATGAVAQDAIVDWNANLELSSTTAVNTSTSVGTGGETIPLISIGSYTTTDADTQSFIIDQDGNLRFEIPDHVIGDLHGADLTLASPGIVSFFAPATSGTGVANSSFANQADTLTFTANGVGPDFAWINNGVTNAIISNSGNTFTITGSAGAGVGGAGPFFGFDITSNQRVSSLTVTHLSNEDVGTLNSSRYRIRVSQLIDAINDAPTAVDGATGATISNVVTNDTLGGTANPTIGTDVTVNVTGTAQDGTTTLGLDDTPAAGGITLDPGSGELIVAAGTTAGTYIYTYEICEVLNPTNCDTATVTVLVDEAPPVATNDTVIPLVPGPVTINPLTNDAGADPLDPTSVVLTGTGAPAGSVLASDGKTLTVPGEGEWTVNPTTGIVTFTPEVGFSGSPTSAVYVVSDVMGRISNEATLSVSILPAIEIIANDDGSIAMNGETGATSSISLLTNDTLGGIAISDPSLIALTPVSLPSPEAGSISINANGSVTVAPGTTPGIYTVVYQICEVANLTNCATAQAEIVVLESDTLIAEIEDDLTDILEEDFANTLTLQSNQISSYSADALDRLRSRSHDACLADINAHLAIENIQFDTDKAVIKPESDRTLDEMAVILRSCAGSTYEIAGHTDSDASDAYNIDLSHRRVVAVQQALAARGVDTEGYVMRGYGESQPIASNATEAGKAQNRRVEFRALATVEEHHGQCEDSFDLARTFSLNADESGANANGQFLSDEHSCITDRREVFEGSASFIDTDQGLTQTAINLSYRREQYRGSDSVFGYFVGFYGSETDVSSRADGEIRSVGLNAGIYNATRLQNELFVDYYLGAAAGRHEFDFDFDRNVGTISTTGDYRYIAGFAGAALSGEVEFGNTTVTPRIGFDYIYAPAVDVDVVAEIGGLSEVGGLDLDSISGGRMFAEVRSERLLQNGNANVWINPRVACYQSLGSLDGVCGIGGSVGIKSVDEESDLIYALQIDGEWGEDYTLGSLTMSASRQIDFGVINGDAGLTSEGSVTMGASFQFEF
ncbi:MAG: OmpA family protein [Litoreibacter sp.]